MDFLKVCFRCHTGKKFVTNKNEFIASPNHRKSVEQPRITAVTDDELKMTASAVSKMILRV